MEMLKEEPPDIPKEDQKHAQNIEMILLLEICRDRVRNGIKIYNCLDLGIRM